MVEGVIRFKGTGSAALFLKVLKTNPAVMHQVFGSVEMITITTSQQQQILTHLRNLMASGQQELLPLHQELLGAMFMPGGWLEFTAESAEWSEPTTRRAHSEVRLTNARVTHYQSNGKLHGTQEHSSVAFGGKDIEMFDVELLKGAE